MPGFAEVDTLRRTGIVVPTSARRAGDVVHGQAAKTLVPVFLLLLSARGDAWSISVTEDLSAAAATLDHWYVLGVLLVVVLQTALIGWLLFEHRQRRQAELELGHRLQQERTELLTITHLERRAVVGEVTAAITHELNQPLEAILHNAEAGELMLESGITSLADMRGILADICRIDRRAAEIIKRLRGLLRKKELEMRPLDVNELARDTAALVTPVASSKGVHVELDLATNLTAIAGDQIHLQQVLLNVMLNGIDAMSTTPRDERRLAVRTTKAGQEIGISVSDCGHGIRAEAATRMFEPFYTTKNEGMGIGLSIARTIVEAHGGHISASNNAERGATVFVTLPSRNATPESTPARPRR